MFRIWIWWLLWYIINKGTFLVAQMVKNLPAMQETWVWSLGWEDTLEKGMATHSSLIDETWWHVFPLFWWTKDFKNSVVLYNFNGFPGGSAGKQSACNAGDLGSLSGLGRPPGRGKGYPLQYSGLDNSMDFIVMGSQRVRHTEQLSFSEKSSVLEMVQ